MPVLKTIEAAMPCNTLSSINILMDDADAHSKVVTANNAVPHRYTLRLPVTSASLPNGSKKAADESK